MAGIQVSKLMLVRCRLHSQLSHVSEIQMAVAAQLSLLRERHLLASALPCPRPAAQQKRGRVLPSSTLGQPLLYTLQNMKKKGGNGGGSGIDHGLALVETATGIGESSGREAEPIEERIKDKRRHASWFVTAAHCVKRTEYVQVFAQCDRRVWQLGTEHSPRFQVL